MGNQQLKVINFHGDKIVTFEQDGIRYVAMRRIVENMSLDWSSQHHKLLGQQSKYHCSDIATVDAQGRDYPMLSMPIEKLPLWLASINPNKIKNERTRSKVERYQAESAIALHDYWFKGAAVRGDLDGVITDLDPSVRKIFGGIMKAVVHNELATILPSMVEAECAKAQLSVVRGITAGDVIEQAGVKDRHGTRGLAQIVSSVLRRYHAGSGVAVKIASLGANTAYVFDPAVVRKWLADGGKDMILKRVAEKKGQGILHLVGKS